MLQLLVMLDDNVNINFVLSDEFFFNCSTFLKIIVLESRNLVTQHISKTTYYERGMAVIFSLH